MFPYPNAHRVRSPLHDLVDMRDVEELTMILSVPPKAEKARSRELTRYQRGAAASLTGIAKHTSCQSLSRDRAESVGMRLSRESRFVFGVLSRLCTRQSMLVAELDQRRELRLHQTSIILNNSLMDLILLILPEAQEGEG